MKTEKTGNFVEIKQDTNGRLLLHRRELKSRKWFIFTSKNVWK